MTKHGLHRRNALFLLTRLCEARQYIAEVNRRCNSQISTHAPLRGATRRPTPTVLAGSLISTHAPLRGATCADWAIRKIADISTHAPLRGATTLDELRKRGFGISTHAPLRGATQTQYFVHSFLTISTHAPLRGATVILEPIEFMGLNFYSTRLCEARQKASTQPMRPRYFYSRASARRDLFARNAIIHSEQFLLSRASARRDWRFVWLFLSCCISTHAPLRGAT